MLLYFTLYGTTITPLHSIAPEVQKERKGKRRWKAWEVGVERWMDMVDLGVLEWKCWMWMWELMDMGVSEWVIDIGIYILTPDRIRSFPGVRFRFVSFQFQVYLAIG